MCFRITSYYKSISMKKNKVSGKRNKENEMLKVADNNGERQNSTGDVQMEGGDLDNYPPTTEIEVRTRLLNNNVFLLTRSKAFNFLANQITKLDQKNAIHFLFC